MHSSNIWAGRKKLCDFALYDLLYISRMSIACFSKSIYIFDEGNFEFHGARMYQRIVLCYTSKKTLFQIVSVLIKFKFVSMHGRRNMTSMSLHYKRTNCAFFITFITISKKRAFQASLVTKQVAKAFHIKQASVHEKNG